MKRLSKIFVLVLTLALLCGVVFAVASSAADAAPNPWASEAVEGVTGAERHHRDFTGESFDYYMVADGTNAPATQLKTPPENLFFMSNKTGHLFSASDVKGNDYAEYVVHVDRTDKTGNDDAIVGVHPNSGITVNNLSYVTFEFDLMTPTDFPENIRLMFETRNFNGDNEYKDKGKFRPRYPFATYNKSAGAWEFDNGTLSLDKGEWAHITLVFQINKTETDEGVNYKDSVAKAYVNGALMSTVTTVFADVAIPKEINTKIYYCGIGWGFENAMTGTKANDGAAIDNLVYTTYTDAYAQDVDYANLPALFEEEDPITDVTDLGPEIVWSEDYTLPARSSNVSVIDPADGTEYGAEEDVGITTLEDAIAFIKENEMTSATLKLYANQYNPLVIDFPVELTMDYNGYKLHNAYEVPDTTLCVEIDENTIIVSSDPAKTVTINYYDLPKGQASAPALVQTIAKGRELTFKIGEVVARSLVNGKNVNAPLATYKIYDEEGNEVATLPDTVTDELGGKTYSVYFDYTTKTFENEIQFSVNIDGKYTYYDSTDLWAAGVTHEPDKGDVTETTAEDGTVTKTWTETRYPNSIPAGAVITLYADCTLSAPLFSYSGNITVDLNGHKLVAAKQFANSTPSVTSVPCTQVGDGAVVDGKTASNYYYLTDNHIYFHSSAEGAELSTTGNLVLGKDNRTSGNKGYVACYFGYSDENTMSACRITVHFGEQMYAQTKGGFRYLYFANADIYNDTASAKSLIWTQFGRDLDIYFNNSNLFVKNTLVESDLGGSTKSLNFVDSNVYAADGVVLSKIAENTTANAPNGTVTVNLTRSKIYGMTLGQVKHECTAINEKGQEVNPKTNVKVILQDSTSRVSDAVAGHVLAANGGAVVVKPETVTVGGKTYATIYGVGTGAEPTARFEIYDVSFEQYTEAMTPFASMDVVEGYWFGCCETPAGESSYDFAVDPYNILTPVRYAVVDENGNELTTGAAVAGETYKAFVVYGKTPVSFAVVNADGTATPYFTNCINDADVTDGCTIVLLNGDAYSITSTLIWKNVSLDMNGKTVYVSGKKFNSFQPTADSNIFIYSSAEGAKFYQAKLPSTEKDSCGYVAQIANENSNLYFGYKDADTVSPYSIDVHCGAFFELKSKNSNVYLAKLNIYKIAGDNYGFFNIREGSYDSRNIYVDECNIFISSGNVIHLRKSTNNGVAVFKNTNFYFNSSGGFVNYDQNATTPALNITFENVGIYGNTAGVGKVPAGATLTFNIKGNFTAPFTSDKFVLEEGKTLVAYGTTKLLEGHVACKDGVYGAEDTVYFQGTYSSKYSIGTVDEFKALAFQNMSLDTNVVVNLYVPAGSIASAKVGETEILNKEKYEVINGQAYYVLSVGVAPKQGDKSVTVTVTLADGSKVDFEVSVARYANKLLGLEAEEGSYVADAKNLMKYILTYIKEVAVKYGGADEETIFAELGDFTVDTDVEITESVQDTTAIKPYVTHAALDLDAYAGFAFKVAENFVGTVKLELAGVPAVEKTYTAEAPAGANEVIVLENVPAHIFRGDVVITVTPAEGETVQASFNLATYAATYDEAYVKALYAYSIAAKEYNAKYPTVGTAN